MVSSMLPHQVGVVSHEPAVLHPASQSEVQVHSNVVVQSAVVSGGIGTERAVPVRHLPLYVPAFVYKGTALFNLFGRGWADNIVQPDVPVSPIIGVAGVDNLALDTAKDVDHIPALDRSGLGHLLWDSHHSFFPQNAFPHLYHLQVLAGLQVLVVLAGSNQVPFSGIAPGHILDHTKVRRVVINVLRPLQVRNV